MKIAQIAPLAESCPLALRRHRTGRLLSDRGARRQATTSRCSPAAIRAPRRGSCRLRRAALRLDPACATRSRTHLVMLDEVRRARRRVRHPPLPHRLPALPAVRRSPTPHAHDAAWPPRPARTAAALRGVPRHAAGVDLRRASAGRCRRRTGPARSITACRADLLPFQPRPAGDYLAFLGRISPEKRPDRAIEIATPRGHAAENRRQDRPGRPRLLRRGIEPLLDHPLVEFIGEIGEAEKADFLGNAAALLFPIDWPEPFGLVMIEAMACGTPVVAWAAARCRR